MNITNRLFTYPVLSDEKDDYKDSFFNVDYEQTMQGVNSLKLSFDIAMNCRDLEQLIIDGQADYVIHLECSTTAYREVLHSVSKHIEHVIPIGRINGSFDAVAFIILKKNITGFFCTDWVDDLSDTTFNLFAGSILAYQNLSSLDVTKDYEEFTNAGSIFSVYKRITEGDCPAEINLDSTKIRIGLGTKDYDIYAMYSGKTELQSLFHSMLILPALVYVFEELRQEGGEETYHNKEWFLALEKSYAKRGITFMEEVLNPEKTSYQLAQEAMELPYEFFYNFTFSSNPDVMAAIIEALRQFKEEGRHVLVRDHIRPAMSYLNAVGGSVVIDCLEREEITRIFSDAVDAIMQGDVPMLNLEGNISAEEEDIDYSDDENTDAVDRSDVPEVTLGCKVVIRNIDKETKTYKYDMVNGMLPKAVEVFTGCKVGDVIEMMGKERRIEDVIF